MIGQKNLNIDRSIYFWLLPLGIGAALSFIVSLLFSESLYWIAVLCPALCVFAYFIFKSKELSLYCLSVIIIVLNFGVASQENAGVSIVGAILGAVILLISLKHLFYGVFIEKSTIFQNKGQTFIALYFLWSVFVGIISTFVWGNSMERLLRDLLLQLPLLICPLLIRSFFNEKKEKRFFYFLIALWLLTLIVNFLKYRSNIIKAYYLFETGRASADLTLTSFMLLLFIAMAMYMKSSNKKLLTFGSMMSIVAIIVSMFRTFWLTNIVLILILLFVLSIRAERRKGLVLCFKILCVLVVLLVALALKYTLIALLIKSFYNRFLYSSQVTVDPSLVNRYIEWANIWEYIKSSLVIGHGYGAQYLNYNWLLGHSYFTGYTHNGYLYILLHGGIIGFVLLASGYLYCIAKCYVLLRSKMISDFRRSLLTSGLLILIGNLATSITLNAFAQRDGMLWIGIIIGLISATDDEVLRKEDNMVVRKNGN